MLRSASCGIARCSLDNPHVFTFIYLILYPSVPVSAATIFFDKKSTCNRVNKLLVSPLLGILRSIRFYQILDGISDNRAGCRITAALAGEGERAQSCLTNIATTDSVPRQLISTEPLSQPSQSFGFTWPCLWTHTTTLNSLHLIT